VARQPLSEMAAGFGYSIYFLLFMMAIMVAGVVTLIVRGGRTKPVPPAR